MKIWQLNADVDNYESSNVINRDIWDKQKEFDASPISETWQIVFLKRNTTNTDKGIGDVLGLTVGAIVIKENAFEFLKPLIENSVEFLPVVYENNQKIWLMNVLNVVDCFDLDNSEVSYYRSNPTKVMSYDKFAFKEKAIKGHKIFKIPETISSKIFVTDELKEIIESSELKGFSFDLIWDSEK